MALNLDTAYQTRNPNKLPVQGVCYADETVLISTNAAAANRLLFNGNNVVKFPDGQKLNRVEETTYLGHQIMPEMDMKHEIQHKMHQTLKTWFKLDTFWKTRRQQFVLQDGSCNFIMTLSETNFSMDSSRTPHTNATKESECFSIAGPT